MMISVIIMFGREMEMEEIEVGCSVFAYFVSMRKKAMQERVLTEV